MALKVKFRTQFPALVSVSAPLILDKTGLSYSFSLDMNSLIGQVTAGIPLGTASAADTGTSGHKLPYLDGANTWGAVQVLPGTATNDSAAAGKIGEYISSTVLLGSAAPLTNSVSANVTSISLTAGDWDLWGNISFSPAGTTTITAFVGWISTTSATAPTVPNNGAYVSMQLTWPTGTSQTLPVGSTRLSLAATTTVYLSTLVVFGTSTMSAFGFIGARRRR